MRSDVSFRNLSGGGPTWGRIGSARSPFEALPRIRSTKRAPLLMRALSTGRGLVAAANERPADAVARQFPHPCTARV